MNYGIFAGYIGRDAELKNLPSGTSVCNFSVAVSTGWGDKKSTLWVSCSLFGERGVKLEQYLTKGSAVTVSGDIDVRAYKAKDGEARAEMTCNVQRVTLQGGRPKDDQGNHEQSGGTKTPQQEKREQQSASPDKGEFDDDIPFAILSAVPLLGLIGALVLGASGVGGGGYA